MLRHVVKPSLALQRLVTTRRSYAAAAGTSRQKRALNEKQLRGDQGAKAAAAPTSAAPPPPPTQGGDGSIIPVLLAVVAAAGAGAAYYNDMIPGLGGSDSNSGSDAVVVVVKPDTTTEEKEAAPAAKAKQEDAPAAKESATNEAPPQQDGAKSGHRVLEISLPHGSKRSAPPAVVTGHPVNGNKVSMKPPSSSSVENPPTVDAALQELQAQISQDSSRALSEAHQELAKLISTDLSELDTLSTTQLKIRLVQMTKDMEDRTKWEAVRLKEFLAMKEKEVQDKYVLTLKKQRLEAESFMEQRLREQKNQLTNQAEELLQEKEKTLQSIIDNSLKIQEQQYNDEKVAFENKTEESTSAKYEELFGKSIAQAKESFTKRMEQRVQQVEALAKKLKDLEFALQTSKDFQSGSVQAHRMSAAAASLIDKLESSKPAGAAIDALKAVADNNPVVTSALEALPETVATSGVATLQELQTKFEEQVHPKCRQAAMVPTGQQGLGGQLLGMAFATLKYPPAPEDPAPESEKDASEYVLARARRHVQLGELDQAVEQMDKLTGQTAFTAHDWAQRAKERVAVEKALKVIRMECALANQSMSKAPGSN